MFPIASPQLQQLVQRITTFLASGQIGAADRQLADLARIAPNHAETARLRGVIRTQQGRFREAERSLSFAYQLAPKDINVLMAIAQLSYRQDRIDAVIQVLEEALKVKPDHPAAIGLMANARRRQGQPKLALKLLERIDLSPSNAVTAAWAHFDLDEPERVLEIINRVVSGPDPGALNRSQAHHVRGLALERLGRYEAALAAYASSKSAITVRHDFDRYVAWLRSVPEVYSADRWPSMPRSTNTSETPVILAGLPRSGTALVEAIIAGHPNVGDAGEVEVTRRMVEELMKSDLAESWPQNVLPKDGAGGFSTETLDTMAKRYLEATAPFGPGAARIVDKHLYNWVYIGTLAQMLPHARVVHVQRDPDDLGLFCFERLSSAAVPWSADLRRLGTVIHHFQRIMAHWKAIAPLPILTVQYESLVRDPETEARRIVDFLGLAWDANCLARFERTREAEQRREPAPKPPNGSPATDPSIGRAARFGALLDPLRRAIAGDVA